MSSFNFYPSRQPKINHVPFYIDPKEVLIIGVSGEAGSGKNTFCVEAARPIYNFATLALAYPLKLSARRIFHLSIDSVYTEEGKACYDEYWGMTNREILQLLGTEAMQPVFGSDVWCKSLHIEISNYFSQVEKNRFAISDVRFPHEVDYICGTMGGYLVKIDRSDVNSKLSETEKAHASEALVKELEGPEGRTIIINNNSTLAQFRQNCRDAITWILDDHKKRIQEQKGK